MIETDPQEQPTQQPDAPDHNALTYSAIATKRPRVTRLWEAAWRDGAFLGSIAALCALTLLLIGQGAATLRSTGLPSAPRATSDLVRPANARAFPLELPDVGLMQPAVDAQGNVWVGEMTTNHLTRLDPRTGKVSSWTPPQGRNNIMAVVVDGQGAVWFTEQIANYIGRFDPRTETFKTYPLQAINGRNMGPQDLQFDASGALWFTLLNGGRIGRLIPATGAIQTWVIPAPAPDVASYPFALTIAPSGQIWFGMLAGGTLGRLDPATGRVSLLRLPTGKGAIFSMAADSHGRVWFTEIQDGKLGYIDTQAEQAHELTLPEPLGNPASLYGVAVARDGAVWTASSGANALIRYQPESAKVTYFQLATPASVPYGVAFDAKGALWFSADATSANYLGVLTPPQ